MPAAVAGIGAVGGFGCGHEALRQALEAGSAPPRPVAVHAVSGTFTAEALTAETSALSRYYPERTLRRIDHYARMALLACRLAMDDAGFPFSGPDRMGIAVATGHGATCNHIDFDSVGGESETDACHSPTKFFSSVHNLAAGYITLLLKCHGPTLSVNQMDLSFPSALLSACLWLREKRVDAVLAGGVDSFSRVTALHRRGQNRGENLPPVGEGSVFFLLTRPEDAQKPYALIRETIVGAPGSNVLEPPVAAILAGECLGRITPAYSRHMPARMPCAAFGPVCGVLPTAMGFDMAAAALAIKTGAIFPSAVPLPDPLVTLTGRMPLEGRPLVCLLLASGGFPARITLTSP